LRNDKRVDITQPHLPLKLKSGDHLVTLSGGGAGIGKPETRDPEAVRADVRNELVSLEMARNIYKVAINPKTLEIDYKATRKLRKSS